MDAYVLSVDETAGQEMIQHLKDHGFGEARIIKGVRPETAKPTINELDECICAGHYECTAKFCAEGKNAKFERFGIIQSLIKIKSQAEGK